MYAYYGFEYYKYTYVSNTAIYGFCFSKAVGKCLPGEKKKKTIHKKFRPVVMSRVPVHSHNTIEHGRYLVKFFFLSLWFFSVPTLKLIVLKTPPAHSLKLKSVF